MSYLMFQLNQQSTSATNQEKNGLIDNSPIYVTSLSTTEALNNNPPSSTVTTVSDVDPKGKKSLDPAQLAVNQAGSKAKILPISNNGQETDLILTQRINDSTSDSVLGVDSTAKWCSTSVEAANKSAEIKVPVPSCDRRASSPFQNGRTEVLIGNDETKFKTTAVVESNNNKLGLETEK